jgi:hypothetical protein
MQQSQAAQSAKKVEAAAKKTQQKEKQRAIARLLRKSN